VAQAYGFGTPVFAGTSLEAGDAWDDGDALDPAHLHLAGAAFVGTDSFLGPAAAGVGIAHDLDAGHGDDAWRLTLFVTVGQGF
jgi:NTE family protein